jgi:hypothetical protein
MESLDFEEWVDVLRERIGAADATNDAEKHSFKRLMADYAEVTPELWYWDAFEELDMQGHLNPDVSSRLMGGDAVARLSADGRDYLRRDDAAG